MRTLLHTKRIRRLGILVLVMILTVGIVFGLTTRTASAAWFNDNWQYRKAITISKTVGAETDVYIAFDGGDVLDTSASGRFQGDCGDIKFTKENGEVLPYFINSGCGTSSTDIDVFFDSIPVAEQNIYMYYGNPSAENGFEAAGFSTEATNYTIGTPASEEVGPGPIAHWAFDEGQGQSANDSTEQGNDAQLGATGGAEASDPTWQTEDMCVSGKCLYFDGSDDYVADDGVYDSAIKNNNLHTVSMWVKASSLANAPVIISADTTTNEFFIQIDTDGTVYWGYGVTTSKYRTYPAGTITAGKWYHIAVVKTGAGDSGNFYLNGNLQPTYTGTLGSAVNNSRNLLIGNYQDPGYELQGFIDEVKIYPYARSAAEVKMDFLGGISGSSAVLGAQDYSYLSEGLVGYWKMDETTENTCTGGTNDTCDSSGNGNDGAWGADATSTTGKFGNGTIYDNDGDYTVVINDDTLDMGTNDMSLTMWVKTANGDSSASLIEKGATSSSDDPGYWIYMNNGQIDPRIGNTSGSRIITPGVATINDNQWHHVAVVYDRDKETTIYIDGTYDNSGDISSLASVDQSTGSNLDFGGRSNGTSTLDGNMDEIRIYNRALSSGEVRGLYNWAPGPIGHWKMDEGTGNATTYDSSTSGLDGTLASMTEASWVPGKFGSALDFDGSADYVSMGDTSLVDFGSGNFTFSAWVYPTADSAAGHASIIIGKDHEAAGARQFFVAFDNEGAIANDKGINLAYFTASNTKVEAYTADDTVPLNTWTHVEAVRDGSNLKIYLNGIEQAVTTSGTSGTMQSSDTPLWIGRREFAGFEDEFTGRIDDVRIYNYARTPRQILADMTTGQAQKQPLLHLSFDEGYGDTANDSGFGGNDGDLAGTCPGDATCPTWTDDGKYGKALSFDGSDDYVSMGDNDVFSFGNGTSDSPMSVAAWINMDDWTTTRVIYKGAWPGTAEWGIFSGSDDKLTAFFKDDSNNSYIGKLVSSAMTPYENQWVHVVLTYDGSSTSAGVKFYLNGSRTEDTDREDGSYGAMSNDTGSLELGREDGSATNLIDGELDDVKLYNYSLTEDEVRLEYNQGKSIVLGASSTASDGTTPDWSGAREYCVPGSTETCNPPVAEWKFDERVSGDAQSVYDSSGNGNTGTTDDGANDTGMDCTAPGKHGSACDFDGVDDYVDATDIDDVEHADVTFSFWAKTNDLGGDGDFITKGAHTTGSPLVIWYDDIVGSSDVGSGNTNTISVLTHDGSVQHWVAAPTNTINDTDWHHFTVALDNTNDTIYIYVDGVLVVSNTKSWNGIYAAVTALYLGDSPNNTAPLDGLIDEAKVYDYARSQAQVAWEYNQGKPVAHYMFDECSGTVAYDASGNGNDGTITPGDTSGSNDSAGTCSSGAGEEMWDNGTVGKYSSSLDFDGRNDYVEIADDSVLDITGDLTVSTWFKMASNPAVTNEGLVAKYRNQGAETNQRSYVLFVDPSGYLGAAISSDGTFNDGVTSDNVFTSTDYADGTWHHAVMTYDNVGTLSIYVDGILNVTESGTITSINSDSAPLWIGAQYDSSSTNMVADALIDDVQIFNYALTPAQVKTLHNRGAVHFGP